MQLTRFRSRLDLSRLSCKPACQILQIRDAPETNSESDAEKGREKGRRCRGFLWEQKGQADRAAAEKGKGSDGGQCQDCDQGQEEQEEEGRGAGEERRRRRVCVCRDLATSIGP